MKLHPSTRALKLAPLCVVAAFVSMMLMGDAALGVQQYPTILNPTTGNTFPQRHLTNAQTCPVTQQCNAVGTLSGLVSVKLAASPVDGDVIAIVDADGNASVNTLTVQGNGHNIDGAATQAITLSGGAIVAQYSSTAAEWVSIGFQRKLAGTRPAVFLNVDARPVATTGSNTLAGDVTGPASANTVAKVHGTTVPAGGALSTGQVLRATGIAAAAWGALDLANASAVTGTLPAARGGTGLTAFPGPGASGNVLTSNGTAWTSSPSPSSGGGWQTAIDCDLSAEPTQNLNAGGAFTMCGGWACNAEQNIFGRGTINFTNGAGLVIGTINGGSGYGNYFGSTVKNAPLIWCALGALPTPIAGLDYSTAVRIWTNVPSQTITGGSSSAAFFGIDNDPTQGAADSNWWSITLFRTALSAVQPGLGATFYQGVGGNNAAASVTRVPGLAAAWSSANATTMLVIEELVPVGGWVGAYGTIGAAWSAGWPSTARPWTVTGPVQLVGGDQTTGGNGIGNITNVSSVLGSALGLVIGAANSAAFATPDSVTFSRVRIDYRL